jgi:hypothetical protein
MSEMFNENWTVAEVEEIRKNMRYLAWELNVEDEVEFVEMMVNRVLDTRDRPEIFLTLDEFIEKCDKKGIKPTDEDREWAEKACAEMKKRVNGMSDEDLRNHEFVFKLDEDPSDVKVEKRDD